MVVLASSVRSREVCDLLNHSVPSTLFGTLGVRASCWIVRHMHKLKVTMCSSQTIKYFCCLLTNC